MKRIIKIALAIINILTKNAQNRTGTNNKTASTINNSSAYRIKLFVISIIGILLGVSSFAQTPEVKTLPPSPKPISYYVIREVKNGFRGSINPQGQTYTIYFEYGTDENFGYTTSTQTVSGTATVAVGVDEPLVDFLKSLGGDFYGLTIHHRLVAVDATGNKLYGRDIPFIVNYFYNSQNIEIFGICYDHATKGRFDIGSRNPFPTTISYQSLEITGTFLLEPVALQSILVYKYAVTSFYQNGSILKQVAANNQLCSEDPNPENWICGYPMGIINNGTNAVFILANHNIIPVPLTILSGTSLLNVTIPATGFLTFINQNNEVEIDYNNNAITIVSPHTKEYGPASLMRVIPICTDATTATFEIQNNENIPHVFILKSADGTEYTYSMAAGATQMVTLPKNTYSVYVDLDIMINIDVSTTIGNHYLLYTVSPETAPFDVSKNSVSISPEGSPESISISSVIDWTASSNQSWLTLNKTGGNGNDNIILTATTNTGTQSRIATVTISNGCITQTIVVTQQAEPGNCLNFDGTDDYVTTADNDDNISNAFTIETWVLWQPNSASDIQFICGKGIEQMEIHTGGSAGANGLRFIPTPGVWLDATNVLPVGKWTHVACTYDFTNAIAKMYINGNEVEFENNGANPIGEQLLSTSTSFYLGSRSNTWFFMKGSLDEFRLWNRARTQAEIQNDYKTKIDPTLQTGLVSYYSFNKGIMNGDNTGQDSLNDLTKTFNGTLNNFALTGSISNWVESYAMVVPTATAATNVATTSFTANWTAPNVGTVENYLLDVSVDSDFSSFVSGYQSLDCGVNLNQLVTGLNPNTTYYYRIRANKTSVDEMGAYSNMIAGQTTPLPTYTIAAISNPVNSGTISGDGTYDYNSTCELIATPQTGYNFVNWTENGTQVSTSATYSFTVTENRTLVANFEFLPQAGVLSFSTTVLGTQTRTATNNVYDLGEIQSTDNLTYLTIEVIDDNINTASVQVIYNGNVQGQMVYSGSNNTWIFIPSAPFVWNEGVNTLSTQFIDFDNNTLDVTVNFTFVQMYTLIFSCNETGTILASDGTNTITSPVSLESGTNVSLTAIPEPNYNFVNWTENETLVCIDTTYLFTVTCNRVLIANFEIIDKISDLSKNNIIIYPNPTSDKIFISNIAFEILKIDILNLSGKITLSTQNKEIDLSELSKGIYIVRIQTKNQTIISKVIKK